MKKSKDTNIFSRTPTLLQPTMPSPTNRSCNDVEHVHSTHLKHRLPDCIVDDMGCHIDTELCDTEDDNGSRTPTSDEGTRFRLGTVQASHGGNNTRGANGHHVLKIDAPKRLPVVCTIRGRDLQNRSIVLSVRKVLRRGLQGQDSSPAHCGRLYDALLLSVREQSEHFHCFRP